MIPELTIQRLSKKWNVNPVFSTKYLQFAASVELEHKDVVGDNPEMAFRIALDHLKEYPDYYYALKKMEAALKKHWKGKTKPSVFL
jgi:hypothetical protein